MERDSKDQMRLSGGQSLAVGLTAATPLFSSLWEENANESRHSDQNRQFSVRKLAVLHIYCVNPASYISSIIVRQIPTEEAPVSDQSRIRQALDCGMTCCFGEFVTER